MTFWILIAAAGGALAMVGLADFVRKYRAGKVSGVYLIAVVVGLASFLTYVLLDAFRPDVMTGPVTLISLLPGFAAIVVVVREHGKASH